MTMSVPEPTLVEYRLARVEQAMDKVTEAIQDFRVDLATKAEVQALREEMERRLKPLEEDRVANRPWVAPTALLSAVAAVLGGAWSVTHGG